MKAGGGKQGQGGRLGLLLPVAVGGFLGLLVFLVVSSRHDPAVVFGARRDDVAVLPRQGQGQGGSRSHHGHRLPQSSGVAREAGRQEEAERHRDRHSNAAAGILVSDGRAPPPAAAAATAPPAVETKPPPEHKHPGGVVVRQQRRPLCDLSDARADVCDLAGDVRIDAGASALVVVDPAANGSTAAAYKVRPYARKGDATCMGSVTELTVRATADAARAPRCTRAHAAAAPATAVVFSASGYAGNLFHDFTDLLVPLYAAAWPHRSDARLVVADADPRWLARYGAVLRALSREAPLDLAAAAAAGEVHCFRRAVVGLRARRELIVEPDDRSDGGQDGTGTTTTSTPGFTRFLRRALSLPRDAPTRRRGERPRLLVIARRGTRLLLNTGAVVRAAEEVGFEAVVDELGLGRDDVAPVARLVNSFDALVGVHGAGLTHMVFLPPGAAVVQIGPWGGLRWIARMDFGDPAEAMGLRYAQYEVAVEESSLRNRYPRDHEVFTNPTALHKKGFKFMRQTFLNGQNITVDVDRFRPVLLQAFNSVVQYR